MSLVYFRQFILLLLMAWSGSLAAGTSVFKLITLNGPGSQSDVAARYFAKELEIQLGQRIVVINAPGGDGVVGMREFMSWGNSCDSMMLGNATVMFAALHKKELGFDSMEKFVPIHGLANTHAVVVVAANSPVKNLQDLVQVSTREGRLIGGSTAPPAAMALDMFSQSLNVKTDILTYKTTGTMLGELMTGRVDYAILLPGAAPTQGLLDAGKLRVIAAIGPGRQAAFPDKPTLLEQGFKPIEVFYWAGFFVNDGVERTCRKRLEEAVHYVLVSSLGEQYERLPGSPQRFMHNSKQMKEMLSRQLSLIRSFLQSKTN